jgi:hypothetical protein
VSGSANIAQTLSVAQVGTANRLVDAPSPRQRAGVHARQAMHQQSVRVIGFDAQRAPAVDVGDRESREGLGLARQPDDVPGRRRHRAATDRRDHRRPIGRGGQHQRRGQQGANAPAR